MRRSRSYLAEREKQLVEWIDTVGNVTVDDVCNRFGLSPSTVRALLTQLQSKGVVTRTHGGAARAERPGALAERGYDPKNRIANRAEKMAIAQAARTMIDEKDVIGICGGSTTYLLSTLFHDLSRLTVVTNSIWIADELTYSRQIDIRMCGGIVNHAKGSLNGPLAEEYFSSIRIDKAFIGADTISLNYGAASGDSLMSHLEHLLLSRAREVFILGDHTKFNQEAVLDGVASFEEIDYIITDSMVPPEVVRFITDAGVKVIIGEV